MTNTFVESALEKDNSFGNLEQFFVWFESRKKSQKFKVNSFPLKDSKNWFFDFKHGAIKHNSGKFFSIEGINVSTNFGNKSNWSQIIINQPEIGILGIITKQINGIRHFLMQAKMEPGNINLIQLSPTLQATQSNYNKVHKGKSPLYLEYFINNKKSKLVLDQLQSEQGGRFLKKRNRNIIIEIKNEIELHEDFYWLSLKQLKDLMKYSNLINMDSRSVLSCVPFLNDFQTISKSKYKELSKYRFINSLFYYNDNQLEIDLIISWISVLKSSYFMDVSKVHVSKMENWLLGDYGLKHKNENRFESTFVSVETSNREVSYWDQPLIKELQIGLIGFLIKKIGGIDYFLVQAKMEPGNIDKFDLSPTVCFSNYEERIRNKSAPQFYDFFTNANQNNIIFDNFQSEEGGRFYHFQNRNMLVETKSKFEVPLNFKWMTLNQIMTLSKFGFFSMEARSLISCLDISTV
ncbi:MAG: NDP-hexose 2,3-dehydratase family protein [Flavobacteriaceae bacterium]